MALCSTRMTDVFVREMQRRRAVYERRQAGTLFRHVGDIAELKIHGSICRLCRYYLGCCVFRGVAVALMLKGGHPGVAYSSPASAPFLRYQSAMRYQKPSVRL